MEERYLKFFSWLFDKDVILHKEFDIAIEKKIYYTDEIKKIIDTEQMQRLKKIMQLSTVILENDNAYHTRYDHSIGTYNNGIILFMDQYENETWRLEHDNEDSKLEITASLIELLTHDLGHLTFSHTLEELIGKRGTHEELTERLVQEKLNDVISEINPKLPEIIKKHREETAQISTIEDGNVDLDRMDYLLHDAIYLDVDEDIGEKMDKILQSVKLCSKDNIANIPIFENNVVEDLEQFLEFRKMQYKNCYNSNRGIANDILCVNFCKIAYNKKEEIPQDFYEFLSECINNKKNMDLNKHTNWNDINTINAFLDIIETSKDEDLAELAIQCTPSINGIINLVYKMIDFPEEVDKKDANLEELIPNEEERKLYKRIKHYVKDKNLTVKELKIKNSLMPDSEVKMKSKVYTFESEDEYNEFEAKIKNVELPEDIVSQIMWNRKIKKYSFKSPTYIENENDEIIELPNHSKFKMNLDAEYVRGAFFNKALLKELGISSEKIDSLENIFSEYKQEKRIAKNKGYVSKVSENEDYYYRLEKEER